MLSSSGNFFRGKSTKNNCYYKYAASIFTNLFHFPKKWQQQHPSFLGTGNKGEVKIESFMAAKIPPHFSPDNSTKPSTCFKPEDIFEGLFFFRALYTVIPCKCGGRGSVIMRLLLLLLFVSLSLLLLLLQNNNQGHSHKIKLYLSTRTKT